MSFVVASMIGTGVFTALGYQLEATDTVFSIMLLWVLGGVAAITGAFTYIALASALPRSGGEYHFLSNIYGPAIGYVTGLLTVLVGFCAPIGASAIALDSYASNLFALPLGGFSLWSMGSLLLVFLVHFSHVRTGGNFNLLFTFLKVVLILIFVLAGFFLIKEPMSLSHLPQKKDLDLIMSSGFGVSLVYVTYSYTGWNAAVYMLDEVKNPKRNVPIAIIGGTLIVGVIYLLVNYVLLYSTPMDVMAGQTDVVAFASERIFGQTGKLFACGLIAFGLLSNISAMVVSASRVIGRMGEDYKVLSVFAKTNSRNVPTFALALVCCIAFLVVANSTFKEVIEYAGFILSIFGLMSVVGLFILKFKNPSLKLPFGGWFYPIVPAIYLIIKLGIIGYLLVDDPNRIWHAGLTFGLALGSYFLVQIPKKSLE